MLSESSCNISSDVSLFWNATNALRIIVFLFLSIPIVVYNQTNFIGKPIRFTYVEVAQNDVPKKLTYDAALLFIKEIGKGWRLPTQVELNILFSFTSKNNIFVRSNRDFTQMIVIRPETVRDPNKLNRTTFQPNNSDQVEDWMSFRREDVETYNLINGTWTLDNTHEV